MYVTDYLILAALALAGLIYYAARLPRVSGDRVIADQLSGTLGKALTWLEEQGYTVLLYRPTANLLMKASGREYESELKADFLVRRGVRQFVVIVKRGKLWSGRLTTKRIRQRLLEYQYAFAGRPILFIELNDGRERVIDFQALEGRRKKRLLTGAVLLSFFALAALWWLQ